MNKAIFTIVAANYLPYARSLIDSLGKYNREAEFFIFLTDGKARESEAKLDMALSNGLAKVESASSLGIENFEKLAFFYDVVEFSTAIKPHCIMSLFGRGYDSVLYLDPDMLCYGPLGEVWVGLETATALLAPHVLGERPGALLDEISFLNNGTYNLGFFAIAKNQEAYRLLDWWKKKLSVSCFLDYDLGLATDQKWANLMPILFDGVSVFRDPAYDVAFWNIHERPITLDAGKYKVRDSFDLKVFHFSGYDFRKPAIVTRGLDLRADMSPAIEKLYCEYQERILSFGIRESIKVPYGFSCFSNGVPILGFHRKIFFEMEKSAPSAISPFSSEEKGSLYSYLKARRLLSRKAKSSLIDPRIRGGGYVTGKKTRIALFGFSLFLRLLGLDRVLTLMGAINWVSKPRNLAFLLSQEKRGRERDRDEK